MKAEMRNRIREYLLHESRKAAGICIYNKTKRCPWGDKDPDPEKCKKQEHYLYRCQDHEGYRPYYQIVEEILEKNPGLGGRLGTQLEDTNPEIRAEEAARTAEKTTQNTPESLVEILE